MAIGVPANTTPNPERISQKPEACCYFKQMSATLGRRNLCPPSGPERTYQHPAVMQKSCWSGLTPKTL